MKYFRNFAPRGETASNQTEDVQGVSMYSTRVHPIDPGRRDGPTLAAGDLRADGSRGRSGVASPQTDRHT